MLTQTYNPDVLSCLANLSSDEVFTPPALASQMLDSTAGDCHLQDDSHLPRRLT